MEWLSKRAQPEFVYPIPPAPRTAVLMAGFRASKTVRVFEQGWCAAARAFAPQAIAGTLAQVEMADAEITHAIVIVGRLKDARLSEADRERLWRRFHVPVFEQIVGERCELLAAECEAHAGLHIESTIEPGALAGIAEIDAAPCGCGRKTPRLKTGGKSVAARR